MKNSVLLILLFVSVSVYCQSIDSTKLKKVKTGIVFSPDYCFRTLSYSNSNQWVENMRNSNEVATFGYTAGLGFKVDLTRKILLETGIFTSVKGQQTKNTELIWVSPNPEYPIKSKTRIQFKYIDIPLKVNYFLGTKKLRCFVSGGLSLNIFTERNTKIISEFSNGDKTSEKSSIDLGYLKYNLAAIVGVGIRYDLTKRASIYIEPVYRRFINSIAADPNAGEHPYSIGTNVGIYYAFKKKK